MELTARMFELGHVTWSHCHVGVENAYHKGRSEGGTIAACIENASKLIVHTYPRPRWYDEDEYDEDEYDEDEYDEDEYY